MTNGQQLLAEYARTGSDAAFRELVTCYVDLVYRTPQQQSVSQQLKETRAPE